MRPDSRFALLDDAAASLQTRLLLAEQARSSIDAQYFIWQRDRSGSLLAERLLRAADRGVSIRLLIDDFAIAGYDTALSALDAHRNIEIRVFNPFADRRLPRLVWHAVALGNFTRNNHRMHNKLFLVDRKKAVVGGRNIGDEYFGLHEQRLFRDIDLMVEGAVVSALQTLFNEFWRSPWSIPLTLTGIVQATTTSIRDTYARLRELAHRNDSITAPQLPALLPTQASTRYQGHARLTADTPDKLRQNSHTLPLHSLESVLQPATSEVLIASAYLVPDGHMLTTLASLVQRGVHVRLLTNSLASNNHLPAHAGYARLRAQLLRNGIELFEFRHDASCTRKQQHATLHTKAAVVDGQQVYVGTSNMDRRSRYLNTEMGLVIDSKRLADALTRSIEQDMAPENAWQVSVENGVTVFRAGTIRLTEEPGADISRRLVNYMLSQLPVERLL